MPVVRPVPNGVCKTRSRRARLGTVILPARNRKDYDEVPEAARNALRFLWAERIEDVTEATLEPVARPNPAAAA